MFPRIDKEQAEEITSKFRQAGKEEKPEKEMITIEDFQKTDLRVGLVKSAERVKKSDKLIKFLVDIGEPEPRQIVAGIGKAYQPEDLVGKKIMVVTNLKPVKLMGVESHGMLLAAGPGDDNVVIAEFQGEVKPGESVH